MTSPSFVIGIKLNTFARQKIFTRNQTISCPESNNPIINNMPGAEPAINKL